MASKLLPFASLASLLLLSAGVLPACSSADADAAAGDEKAEATDEATSAFGLSDTKIVGSLAFGETSKSTPYSRTPRYRAFKFAGNAGDEVDVWVRSSNGDPVTWILDNDFRSVAKNDDASASDTSSHVKVKLPANASATHYIVVRDYWQDPMTFKVELKGGGEHDFVSGCTTDADCVAVDKGCCSNYGSTAVLGSKASAYTASLACQPHTMCPMFMLVPDYATPECNRGTHKCEMVKPADVQCGGFLAPAAQHECPAGYNCTHAPGVNPDMAGKCVQFCGGIANIQCHGQNESCVDDPNDACDPAHGGADCGGICKTN